MAYPTAAQIRRAIKAAETAGICVSGFKVEADGAIFVFDKNSTPKDEYEAWRASRQR